MPSSAWVGTSGRDDDAFRSFLGEVADRIWVDAAYNGELIAASDEIPANMSDIILGLTWHEIERSTGERMGNWRASQALTLYGLVSSSITERSMGARGELYRHIAERLGLEPVPPVTFEQI